MSDHSAPPSVPDPSSPPGPQVPGSSGYPPPPPPPPGAPSPQSPRRARSIWPWLGGGLTVFVLLIVGVTIWALQQDDDDEASASTAAESERGTTTSRPRDTTTSSERSTTTSIGGVLFTDQLQEGSCFDDSALTSSEPMAGQITATDCAAPHDAEVY